MFYNTNTILDRPYSKHHIEVRWPGLTEKLPELVDHTCAFLLRCQHIIRGNQVDLPPLILYRSMIEFFDGISVLAVQSCSVPIQPIFRTLFESTVQLEYLFQDEDFFNQRSRSWLFQSLQERIKLWNQSDVRTPTGEEFHKATSNLRVNPQEAERFNIKCIESRRAAREFIERELSDIKIQHKKTRKKLKRKPQWYSLFDGPAGLKDLIHIVGRSPQYHLLYRPLSQQIHSQETGIYVTQSEKGTLQLSRLRDPKHIYLFLPLHFS